MISFRKASTPNLKTSRDGEPTISISSLGHSTLAKHLKYLLRRNWCAILTHDAILRTGVFYLQKKGTTKWQALPSRCIKDIVRSHVIWFNQLKTNESCSYQRYIPFLWCTACLLTCTNLTCNPYKNGSAKVKGNVSRITETWAVLTWSNTRKSQPYAIFMPQPVHWIIKTSAGACKQLEGNPQMWTLLVLTLI